MSVATNAFGQQPVRQSINSGMEFIRPELTIAPEEQRHGLVAWIEDNQEYATAIAEALNNDEDYAAAFCMFAEDKELRAQYIPGLLDAIERQLDPSARPSVADEPVEVVTTGPSRWMKVREKIVEAYVKLDAGLTDENEIAAPIGQSWGTKTWQEVEAQVTHDPRKTIRFANRPELRLVTTQPSKFEDFMNTNKVATGTLDYVGKKAEKPLTKLEEQSKRLNEFLDDSRPLEDIALDSAAFVANAMIDGFTKLKKYDEKMIAATCSMIIAMNIPDNYKKIRQYEDAMTDKIADKIIATVTEYDYKNAMQVVGNAVKPETKRAKAALAAGAAMSWVAITVSGVEAEAPVQPQENRIESVVPATAPEAVFTKKPVSILTSPTAFNLKSR